MPESKMTFSWRFIFLLGIAVVLFVIFLRMPKPCQEPLTYRFGQIDERFGLTRSEFSMAVGKAAAIWGKPLSRELFREDSQGTIEISLIYDYRQEASDKLKQLNYRMDGTKYTYESMKMRYESLKSEYEQKRVTLENDLHAYNARINAYNAEIESWNRQGGAPETHRSRLMSWKNELDSVRERLNIRQAEAKRLADEITSMALITNEIAARQNLDVDHYRDVGSRLGSEFQEGFFESNKGKQSITIYHFDNEAKLVRLLVHELGHALRLNHSNNPNAVMYRLNQFDAAELTTDDIAALKARCEGK
jgi:hypothetical protein